MNNDNGEVSDVALRNCFSCSQFQVAASEISGYRHEQEAYTNVHFSRERRIEQSNTSKRVGS